MQNYPEQQVFIPMTLLPQLCLLQPPPFLFWIAPPTHPAPRTLLPTSSDIHSQEDHETPSKPTPDTRTQRNLQTRPTRRPKPRSLKSSSEGLYHPRDRRRERKGNQKQNRNVVSNLLRIFFKNTLQMKIYGSVIDSWLAKFSSASSREDFYSWLGSFSIDFKNYIRFTELHKVFTPHSRPDFLALLRVLLRVHLRETGLAHSLTSKRIESGAVRMHLEGLRLLEDEISKLSEEMGREG